MSFLQRSQIVVAKGDITGEVVCAWRECFSLYSWVPSGHNVDGLCLDFCGQLDKGSVDLCEVGGSF